MNQALRSMLDEQPEMQMAPLIDMVFLLLIYFMVTSSLMKQEADLGITLPGTVIQSQTVTMPDEQIIEIQPNGEILLNGRVYGSRESAELPDLQETLTRFRLSAESSKTEAMVTIQASDDVRHERVVDVMNACAGAGIENVTFGMGGS